MNGCECDGAAFMRFQVHFSSRFEARQLLQRAIKDDTPRIPNFADRLDHEVILCLTAGLVNHRAGVP